MLDFLIDSIFLLFWWTNIWHSNRYESCSFTRRFLSTCLWDRPPSKASQEQRMKIPASAISMMFCHWTILHNIYPSELGAKDATEEYDSYLDIHCEIDNGGTLYTTLYDKRDDFTFPIVNFPFISSNIPASLTYGVYISPLIHYYRTCTSTVIVWTEISCWHKGYSNKDTLLLGWSHRFKNYAVAITIWLAVAK